MKVYITTIPGYSIDKVEEITNLLNEVKGELEFQNGKPLTKDQLTWTNTSFKEQDNVEILSFDELFNIGSYYRSLKEFKNEDFVVVLTPIPHDLNWFSGFKGRNIFVDINGNKNVDTVLRKW